MQVTRKTNGNGESGREAVGGCRRHSGGRDGAVAVMGRQEATPARAASTSVEPMLTKHQKPHLFGPNPRRFYFPFVVFLLSEVSAPKEL